MSPSWTISQCYGVLFLLATRICMEYCKLCEAILPEIYLQLLLKRVVLYLKGPISNIFAVLTHKMNIILSEIIEIFWNWNTDFYYYNTVKKLLFWPVWYTFNLCHHHVLYCYAKRWWSFPVFLWHQVARCETIANYRLL